MLSLDRVYKASRVLQEVIRETDMIHAPNINKSANVYLKTENLTSSTFSPDIVEKSRITR